MVTGQVTGDDCIILLYVKYYLKQIMEKYVKEGGPWAGNQALVGTWTLYLSQCGYVS